MLTAAGFEPKNCRGVPRQSGQAIVLILLLTLAALVGGVALFSTGILTSEKIQLQNAADASAYSVSVIEARDLNYTAYMNRAMVANEVAIGQMVSMMSWAYMTRSTPEFIDDYAFKLDLVICLVSLGTSCQTASGAVRPVTKPLRQISTQVFKVVDAFTGPVSSGLSIMNQMYNLSQQVFHLLSFIFSASTLFEIKDQNIEGSDFSAFGVVALARHFTSYYGDLLSGKLYGFVNGYSSGVKDDASGMNRLAQVVNDSRDGFTKNRKCDVQLGGKPTPPLNLGPITVKFQTPGVNCYPLSSSLVKKETEVEGGWKATLFGVSIELKLDLLLIEINADFYFNAGISRQGGSDLRQGTDYNYTWSAADTTDPDLKFGGGFNICTKAINLLLFTIPRICSPYIGFDADPPLPPFGVGAALAGKLAPDASGIPSGGDARDIMYGRASENFLAWDFVLPPFKPTPAAIKHIKSVRQQLTSKDRNINKNYKLRGYHDTEDRPEISTSVDSGDWISGLEAPYLLIALIKKDAVKDSQLSKGRFELDAPKTGFTKAIIGDTVPLGVIAKSEVYYTRPSDLKYFLRANDTRKEKPNAFNPYWQARLVDTSYIDRVAALAFQHGQVPLPATALTIIAQAQSLFNRLTP
jgi:hypothetical protein